MLEQKEEKEEKEEGKELPIPYVLGQSMVEETLVRRGGGRWVGSGEYWGSGEAGDADIWRWMEEGESNILAALETHGMYP